MFAYVLISTYSVCQIKLTVMLSSIDGIRRNARYMQYTSAFCVGILQLGLFMSVTWGSPTLPRLLSGDSPIGAPLTNDEASWVLSGLSIGLIPGNILLALLLDRLGPKRLLLLGAVLVIAGWILLGVANSHVLLVIGRIVSGIGDGMSGTCTNIYICEIASKDIRGRLGAIPVFIGVFGNLFIYGLGPHLTYISLIICCAVPPTVFLISFAFMPDSPYFLVRKDRRRDAERCLTRLANKVTSRSEIETRVQEVEETIRRDTQDKTLTQLLLAPNFRRSLLLGIVAQTIFAFSGLGFLSSYLQVIVESSGLSLSPKLSSLIYGLVQIPSVLLSGLLLDKFGRKPLFCISALGACLALIGEGLYLYFQETHDLRNVAFLSILCLALHKFFVSFGMLYLPAFILGEIFATGTKKIGNTIVVCYSAGVGFLNLKAFGSVFDSWGFYTICWIYGGVCFLGILFSIYMLPETKGKTFDEIQDDLSSVKNVTN